MKKIDLILFFGLILIQAQALSFSTKDSISTTVGTVILTVDSITTNGVQWSLSVPENAQGAFRENGSDSLRGWINFPGVSEETPFKKESITLLVFLQNYPQSVVLKIRIGKDGQVKIRVHKPN